MGIKVVPFKSFPPKAGARGRGTVCVHVSEADLGHHPLLFLHVHEKSLQQISQRAKSLMEKKSKTDSRLESCFKFSCSHIRVLTPFVRSLTSGIQSENIVKT